MSGDTTPQHAFPNPHLCAFQPRFALFPPSLSPSRCFRPSLRLPSLAPSPSLVRPLASLCPTALPSLLSRSLALPYYPTLSHLSLSR